MPIRVIAPGSPRLRARAPAGGGPARLARPSACPPSTAAAGGRLISRPRSATRPPTTTRPLIDTAIVLAGAPSSRSAARIITNALLPLMISGPDRDVHRLHRAAGRQRPQRADEHGDPAGRRRLSALGPQDVAHRSRQGRRLPDDRPHRSERAGPPRFEHVPGRHARAGGERDPRSARWSATTCSRSSSIRSHCPRRRCSARPATGGISSRTRWIRSATPASTSAGASACSTRSTPSPGRSSSGGRSRLIDDPGHRRPAGRALGRAAGRPAHARCASSPRNSPDGARSGDRLGGQGRAHRTRPAARAVRQRDRRAGGEHRRRALRAGRRRRTRAVDGSATSTSFVSTAPSASGRTRCTGWGLQRRRSASAASGSAPDGRSSARSAGGRRPDTRRGAGGPGPVAAGRAAPPRSTRPGYPEHIWQALPGRRRLAHG